jgi:hypothetical protein
MRYYGLDPSGLGQGTVEDSCERYSETFGSMKRWEIIE